MFASMASRTMPPISMATLCLSTNVSSGTIATADSNIATVLVGGGLGGLNCMASLLWLLEFDTHKPHHLMDAACVMNHCHVSHALAFCAF